MTAHRESASRESLRDHNIMRGDALCVVVGGGMDVCVSAGYNGLFYVVVII